MQRYGATKGPSGTLRGSLSQSLEKMMTAATTSFLGRLAAVNILPIELTIVAKPWWRLEVGY
jgi:hypothetical protein